MSTRSDERMGAGNSLARTSFETAARSTRCWQSLSECVAATAAILSTLAAQPPRIRGSALVPWVERGFVAAPGHRGNRRLLFRYRESWDVRRVDAGPVVTARNAAFAEDVMKSWGVLPIRRR